MKLNSWASGSGRGHDGCRNLFLLLNPFGLATCHSPGSRKAAQTVAFYGNNERMQRDFLCLAYL